MGIKMKNTFRNSIAFGKRIEFYIVGLMLKEGLDVYLPLVDDDAIDAVIKRANGTFVEVQIKARSSTVEFGNAALFAALRHEYRPGYWFVFYSERMDKMWIMSSAELVKESTQNKTGKNKGARKIHLNGKKGSEETVKAKFERYLAGNFSRICDENPE